MRTKAHYPPIMSYTPISAWLHPVIAWRTRRAQRAAIRRMLELQSYRADLHHWLEEHYDTEVEGNAAWETIVAGTHELNRDMVAIALEHDIFYGPALMQDGRR